MNAEKLNVKTILTFLISIVVVILVSGYTFLIKKNYGFVVEASCDPTTTSCFVRDCSNVDNCPPNGLENYRIFQIQASDFEKCSDNSCLAEITLGSIEAEEVMCGNSEEDQCSSNL